MYNGKEGEKKKNMSGRSTLMVEKSHYRSRRRRFQVATSSRSQWYPVGIIFFAQLLLPNLNPDSLVRRYILSKHNNNKRRRIEALLSWLVKTYSCLIIIQTFQNNEFTTFFIWNVLFLEKVIKRIHAMVDIWFGAYVTFFLEMSITFWLKMWLHNTSMSLIVIIGVDRYSVDEMCDR